VLEKIKRAVAQRIKEAKINVKREATLKIKMI